MAALECRTVDVLPPSASGEGRLVFQALGAIAFGALLVVGLHANGPGDGAPTGLAPFQKLFRDATPALQRMFREMQEGLVEAERVRSASGQWPSVAVLASQGIPPFADAGSAYAWRFVRDGRTLAYVGVPAPGRAPDDVPAFAAIIQEPEPGYSETVLPGAPPDETHHRLTDGTLLHVTLWYQPSGTDLSAAALTQPFAAGWLQVLAGSSTS